MDQHQYPDVSHFLQPTILPPDMLPPLQLYQRDSPLSPKYLIMINAVHNRTHTTKEGVQNQVVPENALPYF